MNEKSASKKRRKVGLPGLILLGLLVVVLVAGCGPDGNPGAPSRNGIQPEMASGKATCKKAGSEFGLKLEPAPPESGVYMFPDGVNYVEINVGKDGKHFDWLSTLGIDGVIVKGGPDANAFVYIEDEDDPWQEGFEDGLLHPPVDDNDGGDPFDIKEIEFCYDISEEDTGRITVMKASTSPRFSDEFDFVGSANLGPFTLSPGESRPYDNLPAGANYTFTETVASGWRLSRIETDKLLDNAFAASEEAYTVYLNPGDVITTTFINERKTGMLKLVKALKPEDDPGLFDLQINGKTVAENVSDGGGSKAVTVGTGVVVVSETAGKHTDLRDYVSTIKCKNRDGKEIEMAEEATLEAPGKPYKWPVTVREDDELVCVIFNRLKAGTITIVKETDPPSKDASFEFTTNAKPGKFKLDDGGSMVFDKVKPDEVYSFTETVPDRYELAEIACDTDDGSKIRIKNATVNIKPAFGDNITCTFVNELRGRVKIEKTADPKSVVEPGGMVKYGVRVSNMGKKGAVKLVKLTDDLYGDITSETNADIKNSTCVVPQMIDPGKSYKCSFKAKVKGEAGDVVTDVVTGILVGAKERKIKVSDDAEVKIVMEPPDTGAGVAIPTMVGGFAVAGTALAALGGLLRRRSRKK